MKNDYSRLPKWAQSEIALLKRNLAYAENKLNEMIDTGKPSNVLLLEGLHDKKLPKNSSIKFVIDEKTLNYITVRIEKGYLNINGMNTLSVIPRASNNFDVVPQDR